MSKPTEPSQKHIYHAALALLARREHSSFELKQKLQKRFCDCEPLIEQAILKTQADGYLSDERFATAYARSRWQKGFGPERISNELKVKGISSDLSAVALNSATEELDEAAIIERTWRKKFKLAPSDFNEKMKQIRFLRYRGFEQAQIESLFELLSLELAESNRE